MVRKEFKVYSPLTSKSIQEFTKKSKETEEIESDGERILLEGVASTTSRDLHDEIVSSTAIESMSEQALALNIHKDHWWDTDDVVGAIKDASVEDKELHIKFLITKRYTPYIQDLLETGVNLGLSIGGYVTSYDEKNRIINAIELHEISLTAMPANWDTFGTVTSSKGLVESNCIAGACHAIVKKLGDTNMATKEETSTEETTGLNKDEVIELINEYMAEKEETISQEIIDKVESKLDTLVEAKVQELLDDDSTGEEETEETEETKTGEELDTSKSDEEEDKEDEDKEETKSLSPEDISKAISQGIADVIGPDFADQVAAKMFGDLDKGRSTKGSKFEQYQKSLETKTEEVEEKTEKSTYSSNEAAEMLLAKQKRANPILSAAMKNLE